VSYSVDTSALMEAWVRSYPPDVFPTLWSRLDGLIRAGRLLASDEVLRELEKKEDDLWQWAKQRGGLFVPLDPQLQTRASMIISQFPSLTKTASVMRGSADPFVVALAAERSLTVVTAEGSKPTKPKIPDVCRDLSIPCINLVEVFRREGWQV
jgi:hypothetical protein